MPPTAYTPTPSGFRLCGKVVMDVDAEPTLRIGGVDLVEMILVRRGDLGMGERTDEACVTVEFVGE